MSRAGPHLKKKNEFRTLRKMQLMKSSRIVVVPMGAAIAREVCRSKTSYIFRDKNGTPIR